MGLGGTACVLYLLPDNSDSSLGNPTNETAKTESGSYSNTANTTDFSELLENASTPANVADLVFSKHAFARKATIVFWAESLSEDQALARLDQSTSPSWQIVSTDRIDLQTTLLQKLSITAPERALKFAMTRDEQERAWMVSVIFGIWAGTNLNDAIEQAKELDGQLVGTALSAILNSRDDLRLEQLREIAMEFSSENVAFLNYFEHLTRSPIKNPEEIWFEIIDLASQEGVQRMSRNALSLSGIAWVKKEGMAALDEMRATLPADFNSTSILSKIFGVLSEHWPQETFAYAESNFEDLAQKLTQYKSLLANWVRRDPLGMIATVAKVPATDVRLDPMARAVSAWAENRPRRCLEHLEQIPIAYRAVASRLAIEILARTSPTEAAEYVSKTSGVSSRRTLARTLVQQWSDQDVDGAVGWVLDLPEEDPVRFELIESLASRLLYTDLELAFQLALEQPISEDRYFPITTRSLESRFLHSVSRYDLDLAFELLPQVRDVGYSKVLAYAAIGYSLFEQGETARAIRLANELSPELQAKYFHQVVLGQVYQAPEELFEVFDDFPNELKSKIALAIRVSTQAARTLSQEDIAWLESHISDEETGLLNQLKEIFMTNLSPQAKDNLRAEKLQELFGW